MDPRPWYQSATKIVLMSFALTLEIALLFVVFKNFSAKEVIVGILGLFTQVLMVAFSFYYGKQVGQNSANANTPDAIPATGDDVGV